MKSNQSNQDQAPDMTLRWGLGIAIGSIIGVWVGMALPRIIKSAQNLANGSAEHPPTVDDHAQGEPERMQPIPRNEESFRE
jgi:hypothetical protein